MDARSPSPDAASAAFANSLLTDVTDTPEVGKKRSLCVAESLELQDDSLPGSFPSLLVSPGQATPFVGVVEETCVVPGTQGDDAASESSEEYSEDIPSEWSAGRPHPPLPLQLVLIPSLGFQLHTQMALFLSLSTGPLPLQIRHSRF